MPTRRQLEIFGEAAVDCNFRDTAVRLGLSQPAISSHIKALERKVGRELFVRRRGTTPTLSEDGQRLLDTARRTLELSRELLLGVTREDQKQRVMVGLRHFALETIVRPAIPGFIDAYPGIELVVRIVDDVSEMERQLRGGTLDIALFRGEPPTDPSLIIRVSMASPCSIFASPSMAQRIAETNTPLTRAPFILLSEQGRSPDWMVRRLIDVGVKPQNVVQRSQFPSVLLEWLLTGRGIGVLFDTTARIHLKRGALVRLGPQLAPVSSFFLAGKPLKHAEIRVLDFLENLLVSD